MRVSLARLTPWVRQRTPPQFKAASAQVWHREFRSTRQGNAVKPFLLADVGEGITECQVIQWFVQPGARVEEFDKICEVQSDKASVEITSPFAGVIKRLHYDPDDMAITGKPLLDIDTEDDVEQPIVCDQDNSATEESSQAAENVDIVHGQVSQAISGSDVKLDTPETEKTGTQHLATPAVRHLLKERGVAIENVVGSGKDGRVLKEDVLNHTKQQDSDPKVTASTVERRKPLTAIQNQMFRVMTKSLKIPHFLYTSSVDMSSVTILRQQMTAAGTKVTAFAFILKAVSIAFQKHPLLNASLDLTDNEKPALVYRRAHDFGIAIDTPAGLLVPVIHNVQDLSIKDIATAVQEVSAKARDNKLSPADFGKASFTLSNIGAIGGGVVSPVISEPQVAIVGIGRSKIVPAFDKDDNLYRREELILSWSADHRVVDGAECARCAERVRALLENPASMILDMR